jgi:hypothetical protein
MDTASLLTNFERCQRHGVYSSRWESHRLTPNQMLHAAVNEALVEECPDPGDSAGSSFMTLASTRGLELADSINIYRCAIDHAAIADILTTAIRKPDSTDNAAWLPAPSSTPLWTSSCHLSPDRTHLRRFLAVSTWSPERAEHELRSWHVLGELAAHYPLPMQLIVAIIGPMNSGRRHGHWSRALLHPTHSHLRFRRRARSTIEGFKESWSPIYREEHDEINRQRWLDSMNADERSL